MALNHLQVKGGEANAIVSYGLTLVGAPPSLVPHMKYHAER